MGTKLLQGGKLKILLLGIVLKYKFQRQFKRMDGWMNGVLGHFYALSRLNWAGDNRQFKRKYQYYYYAKCQIKWVFTVVQIYLTSKIVFSNQFKRKYQYV